MPELLKLGKTLQIIHRALVMDRCVAEPKDWIQISNYYHYLHQ